MAEEQPIWQQPVWGGYADPAMFGLTGLEWMRVAIRGDGAIPPIHYLTGMNPTEAGKDTAAFAMPVTGWLVNSTGLVPAGVLAALADGGLGCAVQVDLPAATPYTTAELSLTMTRPIRPGGTLTAAGQLIHRGRSIGISEVFVIHQPDDGSEERLVAHSTTRCAILPQLDPVPPPPAEIVSPPLNEGEGPPPYERPVQGEVIADEVWQHTAAREVISAQIAGEMELPPICHLTGLRPVEVGEGEVTFVLPATEWLCPPMPRVQGGFIAMVADAAIQGALATTAPAGTATVGLDLKVNYLRPVSPDGTDLIARGRVIHRGRSIAIGTCEVTGAEGKKVAIATGSAMLMEGMPQSLKGVSELPEEGPEETD